MSSITLRYESLHAALSLGQALERACVVERDDPTIRHDPPPVDVDVPHGAVCRVKHE